MRMMMICPLYPSSKYNVSRGLVLHSEKEGDKKLAREEECSKLSASKTTTCVNSCPLRLRRPSFAG